MTSATYRSDVRKHITMACAVGLAMEARGLPAKRNHDCCLTHVYRIDANEWIEYISDCGCECHGGVA